MSRVLVMTVELPDRTKFIRPGVDPTRSILIKQSINSIKLENEYISDIEVTPSNEGDQTVLYLVIKVSDIPITEATSEIVEPAEVKESFPAIDSTGITSIFSDSVTPESLRIPGLIKLRDFNKVI